MDTVFVKFMQGSNQLALNDSLMAQLKLVINHYTSKSHNFDYSILIPLVSAIIGGLLAIGGQWVIKYLDGRKATNSELIEITSLCSQLRLQLFFYVNSYAYYEQNTEFQFHQHSLEQDVTAKAKLLDEHYKSNLQMLNLHKTIIEFISQFIGLVTKFTILTNHTINFKTQLDKIENFEFGYGKDYGALATLISDDQVSADITEITLIYRNSLSPLTEIINSMSSYKN
jgi:hypothetical protein